MMGICYIIGAGECECIDFLKKSGDFIIAADGGYKHLMSVGMKPDLLIGDFDSLGEIPMDENIIRLNPVKDITDMNAASDAAIGRGYKELVFYGATGGRIDHTMANIQLVAALSQKGIKASVNNGKTVITAITDDEIVFDSSNNGYISVFAHSDICENVSISGLKYNVNGETFRNSFALGVSNEFVGSESRISVEKGTLIIIINA